MSSYRLVNNLCLTANDGGEAISGRKGDSPLCAFVKAKEWPLYDLENKQVMILDEFDIHPAKESEVKIVDWEMSCFLTKYYML